MNRNLQLLEIGVISGIFGMISEYFNAIKVVYIILLVTIFFDTITGVAVAIKHKRFNFKGLLKFVKKVLTYSLTMLAVRLLEIALVQIVETTLMSQVMGVFLVIAETVSNLENLTMLGVPLPQNFIGFLLGNINLPGIGKLSQASLKKTSDYLEEIDDLVRYQIPTFEDECLRKLLEIKFQVWRNLVNQLEGQIRDRSGDSKDIIYYRVMNQIEAAMEDIQERWGNEVTVTSECVEMFNEAHSEKVKKWLTKVKEISKASINNQQKEHAIIESIVVLLYQTILDARKGMYRGQCIEDSKGECKGKQQG